MRHRPFGTFGRDCAVCGIRKPQAHWSSVATCGRICGAKWFSQQRAANRPDSLEAKGVPQMSPMAAYRMGYQAGFQRARYHYVLRQQRNLSARVAS